MKILKVAVNSIANEIGIKTGDKLVSINGHDVNDKLDYQFFSAEEELNFLIKRDGESLSFNFIRDFDEEIGLTIEPLKFRTCGNNCIFCFVYQNPDGMRPALYVKDEDYRLSFLYGNYTTLTNARLKDLDKIITQRLSPQYVSIHATDTSVRKILLGNKKNDMLIEKIKYLTNNRIEIHGQIVLCPKINDGEVLHKTISDLSIFQPYFKSIAIVPLGLTKHRKGLIKMRSPDLFYSQNLIKEIDLIREKLRKKMNTSFVYLADEWYINSGYEVPEEDYYDNFFQVENGVGICREFIMEMEEQSSFFPRKFPYKYRLTIVTSKSASTVLQKYLIPKLEAIENLEINFRVLKNNFFGDAITVAGLLTGQDFFEQLRNDDLGDLVLLPPRCLNPDGVFLDDWKPKDLERKLNCKIVIYSHDMITVLKDLNRETKSKVKWENKILSQF